MYHLLDKFQREVVPEKLIMWELVMFNDATGSIFRILVADDLTKEPLLLNKATQENALYDKQQESTELREEPFTATQSQVDSNI